MATGLWITGWGRMRQQAFLAVSSLHPNYQSPVHSQKIMTTHAFDTNKSSDTSKSKTKQDHHQHAK